MRLSASGTPKINTAFGLHLTSGPSPGSVLLFLAVQHGYAPLGGSVTLLLGGPLVGPFPIPTTAGGTFDIQVPLPNDTRLVGLPIYMQTGGNDTQGFTVSNALEIRACR